MAPRRQPLREPNTIRERPPGRGPDALTEVTRSVLDRVPEPERARGLGAGVGATLGAVLGSFVGGPVGAGIGAAMGGALGVAAAEQAKKRGPR